MGGLPRGDLDRVRRRQHQLRRWLFEIQLRRQLLSALAGINRKFFFQRVQRRHVLGQRRINFDATAEVAQHAPQGVDAMAQNNELNHERRLKVGKLQVPRRLRSEKGGAQTSDLRHIAIQNHLSVLHIDPHPPGSARLPFLIDRDAFAQPARHFVLRHLQRHHVTKFMPQHRLPIRRPATVGCRAVGGNHPAKAHAQESRNIRHAERPHREILGVCENLYIGRIRELNFIFCRERLLRLSQQIKDPRTVNRCLILRHANHKIVRSQRRILGHRVP